MNTGGYSAAARELNRRYTGKWVRRGQIDSWEKRGTRNMRGIRFPVPVGPALFDLDDVANWYAAGVPGDHGKGWIIPEPRKAPLTVW